MKKFTNEINNSKEKKIKKGYNLPSSAVNLGYYSVDDISPGNSLTVVDTSTSIRENYIQNNNDQLSLIANELGMLEDPVTGNNRFSSEDIYVTDIMNSRKNTTDYINVNLLNSNSSGEGSKTDYLYSYYVSRYFTVQENIKSTQVQNFTYAGKNIFDLAKTSDIQDLIKENNAIDITDIYVTYIDGRHYVDETGKKKYKIILERYLDKFVSSIETLCRIIVLLEDPNSSGLLLNYNKVELSSNNSIINSISNYKETINSVLLFNRESEESLVTDYSSKFDKTYSVSNVEILKNKFSSSGFFDSRGYNFYVNRKAIPDNRNYEIFNWRIIGKIKRSFNYADRIDGGTNESGRNNQGSSYKS
jgi:hypothetical protein